MYLPTLLTTLALLTLTTTATPLAIPDAKAPAAPPQNPLTFTLHDTKTGGCQLQLHKVFDTCSAKATLDKKHKCADLPRGQYYQGNACKSKKVKGRKYKGIKVKKQGHWVVSTMGPGAGVSIEFDDGVGSKVACTRDSTKDLVLPVFSVRSSQVIATYLLQFPVQSNQAKATKAKPNIRISSLEKEKSHTTSTQLTMHLLPTLSTLLALLTLTTANPMALASGDISPDAKRVDFKPQMELQTVSNSCHLKIHGFAGCHNTVLVDSNKSCSELPKDKVYKGVTCRSGNWKVDTHSPISLQFQDIAKGDTVACDIQPEGPLLC
ncbi:MAG: hypothetical protein LQ339_003981 [Xanthoria mediterranea]|nr:MAG: hypothetical protein LQ339_003981 [Xanthoria mediterranea]